MNSLLIFTCVSVILINGLIVRGPSGPLVAPLGSSVVLPCNVDELLLMKNLEVEWRRTDTETLVHLYQDGESRPASQQQDYHDRAHFFTDQIQHGNYSLRLDNLMPEDEGQYTCKVSSQQNFGEIVVEIKYVERLLVSGSDQYLSAYDGKDVTLNCSVDSHITPEHIEEVSWKKTDEDEDILVLLYQNNQTFPDASHERYRDRVEFFTAEIPKGNFSLRLKSVRTEDKGVYLCRVFAGRLSANATVVLERLGFSVSHIMVLILCISASGSALLLCCLIYCRSSNEGTTLKLQVLLVICPNMTVFFTFIFWGFTERFWNEIIICCALYILRPLMLLNTAPYLSSLPSIRRWIKLVSVAVEYAVFSIVFYTVLFVRIWGMSLSYDAEDRNIITGIFAVVLLMYSCIVIKGLAAFRDQKTSEKDQLCEKIISKLIAIADLCYYIVPSMQFILLCYTFGASRGDYIEWACMAGFLHLLWAMTYLPYILDDMDYPRKVSVYLFGSVGVVVVNSVVMMTELILKTVNGKRTVWDLRIIVFPSESAFVLFGMAAHFFKLWISKMKCLQCCQEAVRSNDLPFTRSNQNQDSENAEGCEETSFSGSNLNQKTEESHDSCGTIIY